MIIDVQMCNKEWTDPKAVRHGSPCAAQRAKARQSTQAVDHTPSTSDCKEYRDSPVIPRARLCCFGLLMVDSQFLSSPFRDAAAVPSAGFQMC